MASRQRGITLIGFIFVLIIVALFAVVAMNLVPVYSEAMSVKNAMGSVAKEPGVANRDIVEIQKMLQKHFDIDYVDSVKANQAKITGDHQLQLTYEVRKHLIYNLDFVAMFDYTEELNASSSK